MTKTHIKVLGIIATVGMMTVGCYSSKTTTLIGPRHITVLDAATKRPIVGAQVELSGSGCCQGQATNERGRIQYGGYVLYSGPKYESIVVSRPGYEPVSYPLTNGVPKWVELSPIK